MSGEVSVPAERVSLDDLTSPEGAAFMRGYQQALNDAAARLPSRQQVWDVIASVRDAAPRMPSDAETDDIIDALINAGLLNVFGGRDV